MIERRRQKRIQTHIPLKLIEVDENQQVYYGYLENISLGGLGLVANDYLPPGSKLICKFSLPENSDFLSLNILLVHIRKDVGSYYYYGFKYGSLQTHQQQAISDFITRYEVI